MLRYRGRLRLSARDLRRWVRITGFEPVGIRCVDDLANYVRACKAHFWGSNRRVGYQLSCLLSRLVSVITGTSAPINFSLLLSQAHVVSRPSS